MGTPCLLLLTLCLLFSQVAPGVSLLTSLGRRSDHYMCYKNKGTCLYSACPYYTKIIGTCYAGKAKCCK
ncbi:beta-defensin 1 preproprotein [Daubentonia madagascariensis]|uniref:Beta-defensin 1 n=1 Tax=Daubentonia madagascariensis TaxID=31869 RepID=A0ABD2D491_DAUMA